MPAPEIVVRLLGDITVEHAGLVVEPRAVAGTRSTEVLAYLAVHRDRDVHHDELAALLWTADRPTRWYPSLRGVLSRARNALIEAGFEAECLRSRRGMVRLVLPPGTAVDIEQVRTWSHGNSEPAVAVANARRALALLTRPALDGILGRWADEVRRDCELARERALEVDAIASLQLGDAEGAIAAAESLLILDPVRESAYRVAMRGHLDLGDNAGARDAAHRCRAALADRLGVDPSAVTEALARRIEEGEVASPEPAATPAARRRVLVGREAQLRDIALAVDDARGGRGRLVLIEGEPGVGKTAVATEAMERARASGVDVLSGRCSEGAAVPYEPFVEALTRELNSGDAVETRNRLSRNGADILRLVPHAAERFGDLLPPEVSVDDRAVIMTAILNWLVGPARDAPILLVVDDVQWASEATLSIIDYLLRASDRHRLCILMTVRTHHVDAPTIAALTAAVSPDRTRRVRVDGLSVPDIDELLRSEQVDLDAADLYRRTAGSPLLLTSMLGAHDERPDETLPDSVADAVRRSQSRLGHSARDVLAVCAVGGMWVPRVVVQIASGVTDSVEFAAAVSELLTQRLVTTSDLDDRGRSDIDTGGHLRIRHPVILDVVYRSLPGAQRARLHSAVGAALQTVGATSTADELARIAYQLGKALDSDRAAAAHYASRAGESAFAVAAFEESIGYFSEALKRMIPRGDSAERCRVLIEIGRAQRRIGDPKARATLTEAADMAHRLDETDLQIEAVQNNVLETITFVRMSGVDHERVNNLNDALDLLEARGLGHTARAAEMLARLAMELGWGADWQTRRRYVLRGMQIARSVGDRTATVSMLLAALIGLRVPQCADLRSQAVRELPGLLDLDSQQVQEVPTLIWLSRAQVEEGDLPGATATLDVITPAQLAQNSQFWALDRYGRIGIAIAAGQLARAEEGVAVMRALPAPATDTGRFARLHLTLMVIRTLRGDLGEQVAARAEIAERFHETPPFRPMLASALVDVGDHEGAAQLIDWYGPERVAEIPDDHFWVHTMAVLARASAQVGNTMVCREVYTRLLPYGDQTAMVWAGVFGVLHHHLAHLALALGDLDTAQAHLDDAVREHTARGYRGWVVESEYLGLCIEAARTGRIDDARRVRVRADADALDLTAVCRRVDALATDLAVVDAGGT
ncbi:ATP-binding protein [Williamsia sterculiae]|uniref:Transcriptional activator domain-containing protein n=1 Tax=Williamsia sterculiae TaxID=1344003 RepID=A0A1N7EY14_9NOCA|nr:AAA family ATPase [Williamsia sterculiae]SIR92969.1 transcriptional activator domain-containing protein [Williamsia sterculiae]